MTIALWCSWAAAAERDATLADFVPADTGFFVEIRELKQFRRTPEFLAVLRFVEAWATLQQAGQPSMEEWAASLERVFKDEPFTAIDNYLGYRAAAAAPGRKRLAEAVLIAEAPHREVLDAMLRRTGAKHLGALGDVNVYALPAAGMRLATKDKLFVLGPGRDGPARVFGRVVRQVGRPDPNGSLAKTRDFRAMLAKLPADPRAIFYVNQSLGSPQRLAPAAAAPFGLDLHRSLWYGGGLYHRDGGLRVALRVRYPGKLPEWADGPAPADEIARLPKGVLGGWSYRYDPVGLVERIGHRPRRGDAFATALGMVRGLMPGRDLERDVLPHFTQIGCTFLLEVKGAADHPVPAIGVVLGVSDTEAVQSALKQALSSVATMLAIRNLAAGEARTLTLEQFAGERFTIHYVPLGTAFGRRDCPFLQGLELAWAVLDDAFVLATHHLAVREIVLARTGQAETVGRDPGPVSGRGEICESILFEPGDVSWVIRRSLAFLREHHPEYFVEQAERPAPAAPAAGRLVATQTQPVAPLPLAAPLPTTIDILRRFASALAPFARTYYYMGQDAPFERWITADLPVTSWP